MAQPFSIDHHLQSHVVRQLMAHGEQSFSALKPADVENSLFMYHMRKLIARGIVAKTPNGFQLTPEGARWANRSGAYVRPPELPRPMVQLLVVKDGHVLLSERVSHMATHINRYMLPGGLHRFGETSQASAERIAKKLGLTLTSACIGRTELIILENQHHSIVDLYTATAASLDYTFDDDMFRLRFIPVDDVLAMSPSTANTLPQIIQQYLV
ncbi:MAG: NUDIX hydrolase [Acidobacteriota bacterium]